MLAYASDAEAGLTFSLTHLGAELFTRSALLHPLAASGGVLVLLDWPALTPALTEIRLFALPDCSVASIYGTTLSCDLRLGRLVAVQSTPTGALSAGVLHGGFLCCLTFELSGRRRQDARARTEKMYRVPQAGPWWPAVGAPLERGVRQRCAR